VQKPSFDKIVDTFYEVLFRFALSLTRHEADAADLTQETFYIWATKGHQLRDASKLKSWLFTTMHREFLGRRRRATRFPHHEMDAVASELPTVKSDVARVMDSSIVMAALQQIDETYRIPMSLFYVGQRSYNEIAEILGVPIGTVMSRLSRGKDRLRQAVADQSASDLSKIVPLKTNLRAENQ
jgi:RNA polymerase sigma factor (sigma-70 family)